MLPIRVFRRIGAKVLDRGAIWHRFRCPGRLLLRFLAWERPARLSESVFFGVRRTATQDSTLRPIFLCRFIGDVSVSLVMIQTIAGGPREEFAEFANSQGQDNK
jgi:hypothetical protein